MTTCAAVLATDEYLEGARVLFHSLRTRGGMPDWVTPVVLGQNSCDFAEAVPVPLDFRPYDPTAFKGPTRFPGGNSPDADVISRKFWAYNLPFDRVILLDADMLCMGDCSRLWSKDLDRKPFWATPDFGAYRYYAGAIDALGLDRSKILNGGLRVMNLPAATNVMEAFRDGTLRAEHCYACSDQGLLTYFYQKMRPEEIGWLNCRYNYCLDKYWPLLRADEVRIVHFVGPYQRPWKWEAGWGREPYQVAWERAREECYRAATRVC